MIRYRLPAVLGGGEYEGEVNSTNTVAVLTIPGIGEIEVPAAVLTAADPEPADGYYLDRDGDVWRPVDDGDPRRWRGVGEACDWAALNKKWGPLKRLIEDPADSGSR